MLPNSKQKNWNSKPQGINKIDSVKTYSIDNYTRFNQEFIYGSDEDMPLRDIHTQKRSSFLASCSRCATGEFFSKKIFVWIWGRPATSRRVFTLQPRRIFLEETSPRPTKCAHVYDEQLNEWTYASLLNRARIAHTVLCGFLRALSAASNNVFPFYPSFWNSFFIVSLFVLPLFPSTLDYVNIV